MSADSHISEFKNEAQKALDHLKGEFGKLQTGRASSILVEDLQVDVYGSMQPVKAVGQITIPESRTISIKPWDKGTLGAIETAIKNADLSLNPINNGESILINLPQLTEERRRELVKLVHKLAEETKVTIRQARQKAHKAFKTMEENDELTKDDVTGSEKKLQTAVDEANKATDELSKKKEEEVMTV
jgi:ribosome recycling factor